VTVFVVATGPGDPDLLTIRVEQLLASADAVAHEPAVPTSIVELAGAAAKVAEIEQDDADALVALAAAHETVVRLGAGDRLALQAGGAEAVALRAAGIAVEVVPVVLAATAVPVLRGIPVMARDLAPVLTVAVGSVAAGPAPTGTTVVTVPDPTAPTVTVDGAVAALDLRRLPAREVAP